MKKWNRNDFVMYLAKKHNVDVKFANTAYDMIIGGIKDVALQGITLSFVRFGNFFIQKHKGHPVKFKNAKTKKQVIVPDYYVFKFSASDTLNRKVRQDFEPN